MCQQVSPFKNCGIERFFHFVFVAHAYFKVLGGPDTDVINILMSVQYEL